MTHLLLAALLLTLPPQEQNMPAAFYELPEQVREQATLIVTGTYEEGRSPCILRPDGMRVWFILSSLRIKQVYRGEAVGKFISLNKTTLESKVTGGKLTRGHTYLMLLRPSEESMAAIREGKYVSIRDALHEEEILAVVELPQATERVLAIDTRFRSEITRIPYTILKTNPWIKSVKSVANPTSRAGRLGDPNNAALDLAPVIVALFQQHIMTRSA